MRLRTALTVAFLGLAAWSALRAQKPFKTWPGIEYEEWPLPKDYADKHEWTRARLRYPDIYGYPGRMMMLRDGRVFPGYWTMDFPRSDRHLLEGVRRLTRIDTQIGGAGGRLWMAPTTCSTGRCSMRSKWGIGSSGRFRRRPVARVPAARRIPDGRRFSRHRTL